MTRLLVVVALIGGGLVQAEDIEIELELEDNGNVIQLGMPFPGADFAEPLENLPYRGIIPARGVLAGPAPARALRFAWDSYETLIVIGIEGGKANRKSAWVVTFDGEGKVAVAYRATAYTDTAQLIHIDARRALIAGPMAADWSPDSFAIAPDGTVYAIDDMNRGNTGNVILRVDPATAAEQYNNLLSLAMAIVRESS